METEQQNFCKCRAEVAESEGLPGLKPRAEKSRGTKLFTKRAVQRKYLFLTVL